MKKAIKNYTGNKGYSSICLLKEFISQKKKKKIAIT